MPDHQKWTLADVLDFEALLHLDAQAADARVLKDRDAGLWRDHLEGSLTPDEADDRSTVFRRWLELRRAAPGRGPLPGTWLVSGWRALGGLAGVAGTLMGFSIATAALYYSGSRPVNVAVFLAVTVFIQWLFVLWLVVITLSRGFRQSTSRVLVRIADSMGSWLAGFLDRLPGEQRMRVRGEAAEIKNLAGRNGELLCWPPIIALQTFGVTWNLGVLVALLLRVLFTDVAFGWESTWATGPHTAYALVHALATPWLWLAPSASPSLAQVEQSWFHYQSGVGALDREATQSWWPWLVGMIVVYGLFVRLGLLAWASARLNRALRRVDFHEPRHLEPWLRLDGRVIQAEPVTPEKQAEMSAEAAPLTRVAAPGCILIDRSLAGAREAIEQWVKTRLGWQSAMCEIVEADFPDGNEQTISGLAGKLPLAPRWLVVMPAPFTSFAAFAQFLDTVLHAEPAAGKVERGLLVVSPGANGVPGAPSEDWIHYWRDFIRTEGRDVAVIDWSTP